MNAPQAIQNWKWYIARYWKKVEYNARNTLISSFIIIIIIIIIINYNKEENEFLILKDIMYDCIIKLTYTYSKINTSK